MISAETEQETYDATASRDSVHQTVEFDGCGHPSRDAVRFLETGISHLHARDEHSESVARIMFAAAERLFSKAGDVVNARVARQWLGTVGQD